MPEGPEVQLIRDFLAKKVLKKKIVEATILHPKITMPFKGKRQERSLLANRLLSCSFTKIERKGKYLVFYTNNSNYMLAHLGMTGCFFIAENLGKIPLAYRKHVHFWLVFEDFSKLFYADIRRFGWLGFLTKEEYLAYSPIWNIGVDPLRDPSEEYFLTKLQAKPLSSYPIKKVIMRPDVVAGVGNIYACESLYKAKVSPFSRPFKIPLDVLKNIYKSIRETLSLALKYGGSSIKDYVNSEGKKGSFQNYHLVYKKEKCVNCMEDIKNVKLDGRSTFYCSFCQVEY